MLESGGPWRKMSHVRGCIQKFPDWPSSARTANDTALCHYVQLYRYLVSQSSEFCLRNPSCCFSASVYCCKRVFRYRLSTETFGYTLVHGLSSRHEQNFRIWNSYSPCFSVTSNSYSGFLLRKLTVTQLVNKFPAFYGTRTFITMFIRVRHWSLSWSSWIQSKTSHPICLRSILILPSHLRLGEGKGKCLPVLKQAPRH